MNHAEWCEFDKYLLRQRKIVHQVWFGTIPNAVEAQRTYRKLKKIRDSWKLKNTDWCHIEWSKDRCYNLVKHHYPHHLDMYKNYPYDIQRCDAVRYFILHRYGGVYVDMDYYCNRSLDEIRRDYPGELYLVETPNRIVVQDESYVSNSLMISKRNHPFWLQLMVDLEVNKDTPPYYSKHLTVMLTAGPGLLNRVYHQYKHRYKLKSLPWKLFQPYGIRDDVRSYLNVDKRVYAVHINQGAWAKEDTTLFNTLIRDWKLFVFIPVPFVMGMLVGCL